MNQLNWKNKENSNIIESVIDDFAIKYWITIKKIEGMGYDDYTHDLFFSNDSYNLTKQILLKNDTDLENAKYLANYHFQKMLSKY